jgi:diguanylate cyclase (GGDEF)-like protein/PAS domain S-box-containing protein
VSGSQLLFYIGISVSVVICGVLAAMGFRQRRRFGGLLFGLLLSWGGAWSLLSGLEIATTDFEIKVILAKLEYFPITTLPVLWFLFALNYSGVRSMKRIILVLLSLLIIPCITFFLVLTNEWHHLIWTTVSLIDMSGFSVLDCSYGRWFWVHTVYSYALLILATVYLLRAAYGLPMLYRRQASLLALAAVIPLIASWITVYLAQQGAVLDLTPFAFVLTGIFLWLSTKRFKLLAVMPTLVPLAQSEVLEIMNDGVIVLDQGARVLSVNPAAGTLLQKKSTEIAGQHVGELLGPAAVHHLTGETVSGQFQIELGDSGARRTYDVLVSPLELGWGRGRGNVLVLRDITEYKKFEARLEHQALHDYLTGLANRDLLLDRIQHAFSRRRHAQGTFYLLAFDIDDFKDVNNTLGHAEGDRLLRETVARIQHCCPAAATFARLDGDEFALFLEDIPDDETADQAVAQLLTTVQGSGTGSRDELQFTVSVGVAKTEGHMEPDELLRQADAAMHAAKEAGKNRVRRFDSDLDAFLRRRARLGVDLKQALVDSDLVAYYQPIVSLATAEIVGGEALVRWQHPELGLLMPNDFLDIAEEVNLMTSIDRAVLSAACRDAVQWPCAALGKRLFVSVNLSRAQLLNPELPRHVETALRDSGFDAPQLLLEVTENTLIGDHSIFIRRLADLQKQGVRIAIDDFGVHYASLRYLRSLPAQIVKLDRSFVTDLTVDDCSRHVTRVITELGVELGLEIIAEGIETAEQWRLLHELGCPLGQGYLFGRPQPLAEFMELLASYSGADGLRIPGKP